MTERNESTLRIDRLLAAVQEVDRNRRTLIGDDVIHVDGPLGTWKIRCEKNGRGNFGLTVCAPPPIKTRFFSLDRLHALLKDHTDASLAPHHLDPKPGAHSAAPSSGLASNVPRLASLRNSHGAHPDAVDRGTRGEVEVDDTTRATRASQRRASQDALKEYAAHIIQFAWQVHRVRRAREARAEKQATYDLVRAQCVALQQELTAVDATYDAASVACTQHATVMCAIEHPPKLHLKGVVDHPVPKSALDLLLEETMLVREEVGQIARDAVEKYVDAPQSHEWTCARAIVKMERFPLITAVLPGVGDDDVDSLRSYRCRDKTVYFVNTGKRLSPQHLAAIREQFAPSWVAQLPSIVRSRTMSVYDFFLGRDRTQYIGSVVVSRFLSRSKGIVSPVLSIESIVAADPSASDPAQESKKHGTMMFVFCKQLLFADLKNVTYGYIVAQCLDVGFWTDLLDRMSLVARSVAFQLNYLYATYHYEQDAVVRGRRFSKDEDVPSPTKKRNV